MKSFSEARKSSVIKKTASAYIFLSEIFAFCPPGRANSILSSLEESCLAPKGHQPVKS